MTNNSDLTLTFLNSLLSLEAPPLVDFQEAESAGAE